MNEWCIYIALFIVYFFIVCFTIMWGGGGGLSLNTTTKYNVIIFIIGYNALNKIICNNIFYVTMFTLIRFLLIEKNTLLKKCVSEAFGSVN